MDIKNPGPTNAKNFLKLNLKGWIWFINYLSSVSSISVPCVSLALFLDFKTCSWLLSSSDNLYYSVKLFD